MKAVQIITIVIFVAISSTWAFYQGKAQQLQDMREAYKTCLVAYHEINGESEQTCGKAQDATSTEFLCNQAGYCWLEVK